MEFEIAMAKSLLKRHGYAFRIYGPTDVHHNLNLYGDFNGLDTLTFRQKITAHVMEGDDWAEVSDASADADNAHTLILRMIEGTHSDHPEWFGKM